MQRGDANTMMSRQSMANHGSVTDIGKYSVVLQDPDRPALTFTTAHVS